MYISIDNGKKGAFVAVSLSGQIIDKRVIPLNAYKEYDILKIYHYFQEMKTKNIDNGHLFVALEKAHTMPISGNKPNFTNGFQYGIIQTILIVLKIPYQIISASTWQKSIFKGMTVKDTKSASIEWCEKRFPEENWLPTQRSKKPSDGLTDACCLAMYARENRL
jgi:hypothetical protein